jgi:hypothetical protein
MLRTIKRSLTPTRVRFTSTDESRTIVSGTAADNTTMVSSSSTDSTMEDPGENDSLTLDSEESIPAMDPPGCTQPGGDFNLTGVAIESFRAIAISAYMVGETVVALGTELGRMPQHCGYDNAVDTSQKKGPGSVQVDYNGRRDLTAGSKDRGFHDDSSVISYPPSAKKRRKRPFAFFGLSNRAKKNFGHSLPPTASSPNQSKAAPSTVPQSKVLAAPVTPPRRGSSQKKVTVSPGAVKVTPPRTPPSSKRAKIKSSPLRLLQCFSKKPAEEDLKLYSRYRTENENMQLSGDSTVYTIRMSRVPTGSRYAEI